MTVNVSCRTHKDTLPAKMNERTNGGLCCRNFALLHRLLLFYDFVYFSLLLHFHGIFFVVLCLYWSPSSTSPCNLVASARTFNTASLFFLFLMNFYSSHISNNNNKKPLPLKTVPKSQQKKRQRLKTDATRMNREHLGWHINYYSTVKSLFFFHIFDHIIFLRFVVQ